MENNEFEKIKIEKKKKGIYNNKLKKKLGEQCVYCGCNNILILTIDHIKPLARGGEDSKKNKQVVCFTCNQLKGILTDKEFIKYMKALKILKNLNKMKLIFNQNGQPNLLFNERAYPQTIKEMEEKNGKTM